MFWKESSCRCISDVEQSETELVPKDKKLPSEDRSACWRCGSWWSSLQWCSRTRRIHRLQPEIQRCLWSKRRQSAASGLLLLPWERTGVLTFNVQHSRGQSTSHQRNMLMNVYKGERGGDVHNDETYRSKPSSTCDVVGVIHEVEQLHLLERSLTGGETPRLGQHLTQKHRRTMI